MAVGNCNVHYIELDIGRSVYNFFAIYRVFHDFRA